LLPAWRSGDTSGATCGAGGTLMFGLRSFEMSDLLKINVNDHTERKNGLTYLSWAWAWAEVLKIDPQATWVPMMSGGMGGEAPWFSLPDGSMLVGVTVTIKGHAKQCLLPVMDHRNKAIKNPDAFALNTAVMRCLAKCIAMHGLGLYIYAGEDLPEEDKEAKPEPDAKPRAVIKATDGAEAALTPDRRAEMDEMCAYLIECHQTGKDLEAARLYYEIEDNDSKVYVWQQLGAFSKLRASIKANSPHKVAA
jgi:hypothetical protein